MSPAKDLKDEAGSLCPAHCPSLRVVPMSIPMHHWGKIGHLQSPPGVLPSPKQPGRRKPSGVRSL